MKNEEFTPHSSLKIEYNVRDKKNMFEHKTGKFPSNFLTKWLVFPKICFLT